LFETQEAFVSNATVDERGGAIRVAIRGALFDNHGVGNWERCTADVGFAGGVREKKTAERSGEW